jgi:hypothetical protein
MTNPQNQIVTIKIDLEATFTEDGELPDRVSFLGFVQTF